MVVNKTRVLEQHKSAAPNVQNRSKAGAHGSLGSQKIAHINSSLTENGPQRSLGHVARMMRDRCEWRQTSWLPAPVRSKRNPNVRRRLAISR
jgi:hypothetical protein